MAECKLNTIGTIANREGDIRLILDPAYTPALKGLEGFSHIQVLWWFSECDDAASRRNVTEVSPYRNGPGELGVFATRSPMRPNPIALSTAEITYIDRENAVIGIAYLEAFDSTPVLDIKPYTPSADRVENPRVPDWCSHWPQSYEASGSFDWEKEMNI